MSRPLPLHRLPAVGWAAAGVGVLSCGRRRPLTESRALSAAALAGGAAWLGIGALAQFHRAGTTHSPIAVHRATVLVDHGVYAVSRNPMYVALVGSLASLALLRGRAAGALPVAAYAAWLDRGQIAREERSLAALFADEYPAYTRRVRRWLGRRAP